MRARRLAFAAGAFALVIVALLVIRPDTDAPLSRQVTATFVGYDVLDGGTEKLALIRLTNSSSRSFWYITTGEAASNGTSVVACMYRADTGGGWNEWGEGVGSPKKMTSFVIAPGDRALVAARISSKVPSSQIGIHCNEVRATWPEPLQSLRRLWWKVVPPKTSNNRAWCPLGAAEQHGERVVP